MNTTTLSMILFASSASALAGNCDDARRTLAPFTTIEAMRIELPGRGDLMELEPPNDIGNGVQITYATMLTPKIDGYQRECSFGIAQRNGRIFDLTLEGESFTARKSVCETDSRGKCGKKVSREFRVVGSDMKLAKSVLKSLSEFSNTDVSTVDESTRVAIETIRRERVPRQIAIDSKPFEATFTKHPQRRIVVELFRDGAGRIKVRKTTEENDQY